MAQKIYETKFYLLNRKNKEREMKENKIKITIKEKEKEVHKNSFKNIKSGN